MKPRVLFVDDEPSILTGLRNLLRKERDTWEMVFSASGEHALAEARTKPFDVVISDMRMPGMNGATLFQQLRTESPSTVRIMLSGQADRDSVLRALPALHQLLGKPCDGTTLRSAIARGVSLSRERDAEVNRTIGQLHALPSPRETYEALMRLLERNAPESEVAAVVETDPAMTAKVLQIANCAYFASGKPTASIEDAVMGLGTNQLRAISKGAGLFATRDEQICDGFSLTEYQRTACRRADLTMQYLGERATPTAWTAALLADVGALVCALARSSLAHNDGAHRGGAALLGIWGLPQAVVDAVLHQRQPELAPESLREVVTAIAAANAAIQSS